MAAVLKKPHKATFNLFFTTDNTTKAGIKIIPYERTLNPFKFIAFKKYNRCIFILPYDMNYRVYATGRLRLFIHRVLTFHFTHHHTFQSL